jgi:hypothetical protein
MPKFRFQPFGISGGPVETYAACLKPEDYQLLNTLKNSENGLRAAETLRLIYSQVTPHSKIVHAFSALEELFGTTGENILEQTEIKALLEHARENLGIPKDSTKYQRLQDALYNSVNIKKRTRNQIIAEKVVELLDIDESVALRRVREISQQRGKLAHTTSPASRDISSDVEFVEAILKAYIQKETGVIISESRGGFGQSKTVAAMRPHLR